MQPALCMDLKNAKMVIHEFLLRHQCLNNGNVDISSQFLLAKCHFLIRIWVRNGRGFSLGLKHTEDRRYIKKLGH